MKTVVLFFKSLIQKTRVWHCKLEKGVISRENWNHAFFSIQKKYFLSGLGTQSAKKINYQILKNQ